MLINRWKKDKDKDKSNATSAAASQNASGSGGSSGGSGFFANSSSNSKSSTLGSAVKKKRKSGKDGKIEVIDVDLVFLKCQVTGIRDTTIRPFVLSNDITTVNSYQH